MPANSPTNPPKKRETLKSYFRKGSLPTEQSFADLIDSTVNRLDDGFNFAPETGWQVAATDEQARLLALYQDLKQLEAKLPAWLLELPTAGAQPGGLSFSVVAPPGSEPAKAPPGSPTAPATPAANLGEPAPAKAAPPSVSRLHLRADGNVGIGTTEPAARLDVRGFVASQGRIGAYTDARQPGNEVLADGKWHPILTGLDGLHAFEIVAAAYGQPGQGRYALTHATVLSAFGKSRSRIFRRNAWFWGWFQTIQFQWTGTTHNYGLEMRTASPFGAGSRIVYHITHLFDDRRPAGPQGASA